MISLVILDGCERDAVMSIMTIEALMAAEAHFYFRGL